MGSSAIEVKPAVTEFHKVHTDLHGEDFWRFARVLGVNRGVPFFFVELCVHFVKLCDRWLTWEPAVTSYESTGHSGLRFGHRDVEAVHH